MKRLFFIFCLLVAGAAASAQENRDSLAFVNAEWNVTRLKKGAVAMQAAVPMFGSMQSIAVIKYPARKFRMEILHRPGETAGATGDLAEDAGAEFAVNAGYFNMKKLCPSVYFRVGDEVLGHTYPNEVYRVDGIIGLKGKKGRRIIIEKSDTTQYEQVAGRCHTVLASGPLLVDDGEIVVPEVKGEKYFYDRRHPRSVVGTDEAGNVYLVVIDGRFPGQADGTTIYETAYISSLLGMKDALNLDGGGSSALWSEETGTINHPSDNKVFDHEGSRKVPNIIIAY